MIKGFGVLADPTNDREYGKKNIADIEWVLF